MKQVYRLLGDYFKPYGVTEYSACAFEDILPLIPCRAQSRLPEHPQSVIACLFPFYTGPYPHRNVSRYAMVRDYHRVAGDILREASELLTRQLGGSFVSFVDASPIREVECARLAGLGNLGRNGLLLHPVYGSCTFIGTIVTDHALAPRFPAGKACSGCGACIRACPTGALGEQDFRQELCRSHITQKKGVLTEEETAEVRAGGLVWGCDLCLDACPHNQNLPFSPIPGFAESCAPVVTRENLDMLYEEHPYNYRKKSVLLRNIEIIDRSTSHGNSEP